MKRLLILAVPALTVSAMPLYAETTVTTTQSEVFSEHLTDAEGRPLYLFTTDKQEGKEAAVTCTSEDCLQAWPLLTTDGVPEASGGANATLLGTMEYEGDTVVTYNGWPLYYFEQDVGADAPKGHDIESFGGEWYLVTPQGEKAAEGT